MRRAFSLLELLITIAFVAILAALTFPLVERFQEKGRGTACISNLRSLGSALNLYLADNSGMMPVLKLARRSLADDEPVIDNTLDRYVSSRKAFACPSDERFAKSTGTSYHWNVALNGQAVANLHFMGLIDRSGHIPVMGDKEGFHRDPDHKINLLYADGHASKELNFVEAK
jgi:prepilin-type N-terminal cleavage/methylation domain-containing protein/prepilin-type processing-associated H-X9-DG protein